MKRLAFNGGEISPAMTLRSDMDTFPRSCSSLLNWELSPTGGITRRHGMRIIAEAQQDTSRLIPFTYSSELTYLIEVGSNTITVRNPDGSPVSTFTSEQDGEWAYGDISAITWLQLNSILLIISPECQPMQLKIAADYTWSLAPFNFKNPPWHTLSLRDHPITLTPDGKYYSVAYHEDELEEDTDPDPGDILRVSYYTERQEASASSLSLRDGNWTHIEADSAGLTASSAFQPGDKIAVATTPTYELFICTKEFTGKDDFTSGATSPANYTGDGGCFMRAEDATGFDEVTPIDGLTSASNYKKGDKIKLRSGYWKLYTCMRPFTPDDYQPGLNSPTNYPAHFTYGIPVGEALTCRGTWKFHCSGTWFGAYEIRRSYTTGDLTATWETLGEALSLIGSATNNLISGDEEEESCHLRLYLTQIRYVGADIAAGWPPDECGNTLVVSPYKHDMHLTVLPDGLLQDTSPIIRPLTSSLTTDDWSWCAFNGRYGYPAIAALHESRLVLAATSLQPQTIWLSRTDDLNNFAPGATDNAALHLTMTTQTQAAICWLTSRGSSCQLGTEDGEWVLQSTGGPLSPSTARIVNHGRIGSAHIPAVSAADRLLYAERGAGRLYQFAYDYTQDAFLSQDLTIFADHILMQGGGITSGTIMRKPYCVAIFTLDDGTLALMSYNTHHNVNAWHRWTTAGRIESVCALPNGNLPDNLYLITERNGTRYIELVNADSPHLDAGQHDYTSEMETTAFTHIEADERATHQAEIQAYIATTTPADAITIRTASTSYNSIARNTPLEPGWHRLGTTSGYSDRPLIGLRVNGNVPCSILAVQM